MYIEDLYVRRYGSGKNRLLCVNGAMADCSFYDDLAMSLSDTYTVYTYDHPGYGRSRSEGKSLPEQEKDIEELVHRIGPCTVLGHSCGAIPVLEAMLKGEDNIQGAILYEPFLCDLSQDERIEKLKKIVDTGGTAETLEEALLAVLSAEEGARPFGEEQRKYFARNSQTFLKDELQSMMQVQMDYEKLQGKKMVIGVGSCSQGWPCEEMALNLQEKTGAVIMKFTGAHDAPYEEYRKFAEKLKEITFL